MNSIAAQMNPGVPEFWEHILIATALIWLGCFIAIVATYITGLFIRGVRVLARQSTRIYRSSHGQRHIGT